MVSRSRIPPPSCTGMSESSAAMMSHRLLVPRLAGDGAVQVDHVQAARALAGPLRRGLAGLLREHGGRFHAALFEAHAVAVFQVDRWDDHHGETRSVTDPKWRSCEEARGRRRRSSRGGTEW